MSKNGIESVITDRLDALKSTIHQIGDRLGDVSEDVSERGSALLKNLTRMIKQNPLAAVGIAVGAGALAMLLLRRD
jgi:ElaB/YqjD/DUF883 family membrane-anchored ribosome-binding protein